MMLHATGRAGLRAGGADLFQGLFYERPNLVVRRPAPLGHTAALSALLDQGSAERARTPR